MRILPQAALFLILLFAGGLGAQSAPAPAPTPAAADPKAAAQAIVREIAEQVAKEA